MAKAYITTTAETQVSDKATRKCLITVNGALTGNIKVIDGTSGSTANVATITNPGVGNHFEYWDFANGVRVIASATCDITVSTSSSFGPH